MIYALVFEGKGKFSHADFVKFKIFNNREEFEAFRDSKTDTSCKYWTIIEEIEDGGGMEIPTND